MYSVPKRRLMHKPQKIAMFVFIYLRLCAPLLIVIVIKNALAPLFFLSQPSLLNNDTDKKNY